VSSTRKSIVKTLYGTALTNEFSGTRLGAGLHSSHKPKVTQIDMQGVQKIEVKGSLLNSRNTINILSKKAASVDSIASSNVSSSLRSRVASLDDEELFLQENYRVPSGEQAVEDPMNDTQGGFAR